MLSRVNVRTAGPMMRHLQVWSRSPGQFLPLLLNMQSPCCCSAKLRRDMKIRDAYKLGKTLGTGGGTCCYASYQHCMAHKMVTSGQDSQWVLAVPRHGLGAAALYVGSVARVKPADHRAKKDCQVPVVGCQHSCAACSNVNLQSQLHEVVNNLEPKPSAAGCRVCSGQAGHREEHGGGVCVQDHGPPCSQCQGQ